MSNLIGLGIFLSIFVAVVGGVILLYHHFLQRNGSAPSFGDVIRNRFHMAHEGPSVYPAILRSLRRQLKDAKTRTLTGQDKAAQVLTVQLCQEDLAEVYMHVTFNEFAQDIVDSFVGIATRSGWRGVPNRPMELYVLVDPTRFTNSPSILPGRPAGNETSVWITPNVGPIISAQQFDDQETDVTMRFVSTQEEAAGEHVASLFASDNEETRRADPDVTRFMAPSELPAERVAKEESVVVTRDGKPIASLTARGASIGRHSTNSIIDLDKSVSRRHATISYIRGEWVVIPKPGASFRVNNQLRRTATTVRDGDELSFADSPTKYRLNRRA